MKLYEKELGEFVENISDTEKINKDEVILVNTSDVENGKVINHNYVKNSNLKGQFKKRFKRNDILYSEIRPKNKRFAYIDFDSEDYIASTKLMVSRNKGNIDNEYLFVFTMVIISILIICISIYYTGIDKIEKEFVRTKIYSIVRLKK